MSTFTLSDSGSAFIGFSLLVPEHLAYLDGAPPLKPQSVSPLVFAHARPVIRGKLGKGVVVGYKTDKLTPTLEKIRTELTQADLVKLLDSYFCHTINALENAMNQLKTNGTACIFIGNPLIVGLYITLYCIELDTFPKAEHTLDKIFQARCC